jgi:DNA invertase Pin-like site-specific DNA recombinase
LSRYFTYCRKSTEDEDHQILSIESQRQELQLYAEREQLQIVALREEARSAKSPGRPIFNDMLKRIERGEADGILAWHPDRLARNALDGGQIIQLLDTGKITALRFPTYTFENTSQGKFMLAIMFGQSKYYVDSLSENVRRGNRTKREKGWLPNLAPIGYLNGRSEAGEKVIVRDSVRFPILQKLWHLFLSGGYSVPEILDIATNKMGLRTLKRRRIGGNPMSPSGIYRMLTNPFYAGQLVYDNQWYPGKHEPMVALAEFDRAQVLLGRPGRTRSKKHEFPYTGLIRCAPCGAGITAEGKVNRYGSHYVYYHCTHKKRIVLCAEKCVEEKQLEEQILGFLKSIHITDDELKEPLAIIEEERTRSLQAEDGFKEAIERTLESCRRNLDNLTKLRYRELIGEEEFLRQREELAREEIGLRQRLKQLDTERWVEPSRNLFLFSNRALFWLTHGTPVEKRLILATLGSNLSLSAKKLNIDAREPFALLRKRTQIPNWCTIVNDVRTFFREEPGIVIPALPEPNSQ